MDLASAEAEIRHVFGDTPITEASIGAAPPDILVKLSGPKHIYSFAILHLTSIIILRVLGIHACSNPSPLTKSMQLYFRNYMKY